MFTLAIGLVQIEFALDKLFKTVAIKLQPQC